MTTPIAYTPYDGSSTPFTIGLSQLDFDRWIEPDEDLGFYLDEKERLLAENRRGVFQAENGTQEAQEECLDLLVAHLEKCHGDHFTRHGNQMQMAGRNVDISDTSVPGLIRAGRLIQDDLVLMRRKPNGWHFSAGFVAFPSSWSVEEKFGLPMDRIHAEVPGFEGGSRNAELINRMFDKLPADRLVTRLNWSIRGNLNLAQPVSKHAGYDPGSAVEHAARNVIRVERQTLRRLPVSGDIAFTIRIYSDPIAAISTRPDSANLFASLAGQLEALTPEQLAYKGLGDIVSPLAGFLRSEAERAA